ncbi:MAG: hypothetical protein V2I36_14565 [Desulfopila sp.]|jgi:hypothetical protein|nr:hypothetical protein [Desulfopila sp.]
MSDCYGFVNFFEANVAFWHHFRKSNRQKRGAARRTMGTVFLTLGIVFLDM